MVNSNEKFKIGQNVKLGDNVSIGFNTIIHDDVTIGDNVVIGDFVIIYPNVCINSNSIISSFSTIGEPTASYYKDISGYQFPTTIIGSGALIRSYTIIYADVTIGEDFQTGHKVSIREKSLIGKNVRIGTNSDVQGYCKIGSYVSCHSNVHIGAMSEVEDFVWIFPYVILTNDPTPPSETLFGVKVKTFATIAAGSVILPDITIGEDSLVGAQSLVKSNVEKGTVVAGNPARFICNIKDIRNKATNEEVYPWRHTFKRGMPWEEEGYITWYNNLDEKSKSKLPQE